jgi:hypothetical protein
MRKTLRIVLPVVAFALTASISFRPSAASAADHLDGPRLMANPVELGNLDINDVYAFRAPSGNNTVLIMTLSPAAGLLAPASFSLFAGYEFKIDNTGDAIEDLTIHFDFGAPGKNGQQPFVYSAFDPAGHVKLTGGGFTGKTNKVPGGGQVRADLFDDPFFFDLIAFNTFKAQALMGNPNAASIFLNRNAGNLPHNFFAGFNVIAIVLEVPSVRLQSSPKNTKIGVWARTLLFNTTQFDRMGRPAINTVLIPDKDKDMFNSLVPTQDRSLFVAAAGELAILFGNPPMAIAHAQLLLPDILTFDTSSSQGFLNGRRLSDDVVDAEFNLLSNGIVKTDNVPNDSVFFVKFPYLGTPNPKQAILAKARLSAMGVNTEPDNSATPGTAAGRKP